MALTQRLRGRRRTESLASATACGLASVVVVVSALSPACGHVDAAPASTVVVPPVSSAASRSDVEQTGIRGQGGTGQQRLGNDASVLPEGRAVEGALGRDDLVVLRGRAVARWHQRLEFPRGCRPLLAAEESAVVACAATAEVTSVDATGAVRWRSHPVGAAAAVPRCQRDGECRFELTEVAAGADGSWIGGWFFGALHLGDATLVARRRDAFLASVDDHGRVVSSVSLSSPGDDSLQALVTERDGALVAWSTLGRFETGGQKLGRRGMPGSFLGRFSRAGALDWYREASGAKPGVVHVRLARAQGAAKGVALQASFTGALQLGSRQLVVPAEPARCPRDGLRRPATGAGIELVVASLGDDLRSVDWLERAGTASRSEQPLGVARSPRGEVAIVGRFDGELRLGAASAVGHASSADPCAASTRRETYLGVLSAAGEVLWLRTLPAVYASNLYFDARGRLVVLGVEVRPGDMGNGLKGPVGNYLLGFDGADGSLSHLVSLPPGSAALTRLAASGDPLVAVSAAGSLELLRLQLD